MQLEKNYWELNNKSKEILTKIIKKAIDDIASYTAIEGSNSRYEVGIDLTNMGVGPYHVKDILEDLGYIDDDFDTNGWQMDYWFHFQHPESDKFPSLCLSGTAIIHEMYLRGEDDDYVTYAEREERLKNDTELQKLIKQGMNIIAETERLLQEDNNE